MKHLKNPKLNFLILIVTIAILRVNSIHIGLRPWNHLLYELFSALPLIILILILINGVYAIKKREPLTGVFQIIISGAILWALFIISLANPIEYEGEFHLNERQKVEGYFNSNYSDHHYLMQQDKILFIFSRQQCLETRRLSPYWGTWNSPIGLVTNDGSDIPEPKSNDSVWIDVYKCDNSPDHIDTFDIYEDFHLLLTDWIIELLITPTSPN